MRGLMVAVIGMGILIVAGVTVLVVTMIQRMSAVRCRMPARSRGVLDEPPGTRIAADVGRRRPDGGAAGRRRAGPGGDGGHAAGRVVGRVGLAR